MNVEWINHNGTDIAVKKLKTGYRVVYPWKNQDGSFNKRNLMRGFWIALIIMGVFFVNVWSFDKQLTIIESHYQKIAEDPIGWCKNVNAGTTNPFEYSNFTLPELETE